MHVDRSRFLFLTASLAAAACNQPQPAASPDTGGAEPAHSRDPNATANANSEGSQVWLEIEPGTEDKQPGPGDPNCNNTIGSPSPCSISPPAGHCESFDMTQRLCSSFETIMQPRAAEAAVDCMLAASGTQRICDWDFWNECAGAGMQASCVEPATRSECESISSMCGGSLDVFTCQQALSAMRPQNQANVASCIREFCEIGFCVTDFAMF